MVKSMTAYSRLSKTADWGHFTIEVQSLNRKHLEINVSLPKEFLFLDPEIKKRIQKKLHRGKINFYLTFALNEKAEAFKLKPNVTLAKELKKGWSELAKHLDLEEKGLYELLYKESDLFQSEFQDSFLKTFKKDILNVLDQCLDHLIEMRSKEGEHLKKELLTRAQNIKTLLDKGKGFVENASKEHQNKLKARLEELLESSIEVDERFLKEVAILADKSDLTEEITRIDSHLKLFKSTLNEQEKSLGKTLDFITQELNREWNTIGSKCFDTQTSHLVIQAKGECEKIREQVQNIE